MAVLKTASPNVSPVAPKAVPRKTVPSSSARSASGARVTRGPRGSRAVLEQRTHIDPPAPDPPHAVDGDPEAAAAGLLEPALLQDPLHDPRAEVRADVIVAGVGHDSLPLGHRCALPSVTTSSPR